jgi:2-aminoadipate transaminase
VSIDTALAAIKLSPYGQMSIDPSPVNQMMAEFDRDFRDGVDVNLGVGYVNEHTIPVSRFSDALDAVIGNPERYRQAFNYGGPAGTVNLLASTREFLVKRGLAPSVLDEKELIIGPCGATSVLESLAEVVDKGIVITSDPMYYIYCDALERKGFEVLAVPEDAEGLNLTLLDKNLDRLRGRLKDLAFFYVVTVNNPSCTILSNQRRRALVEVAAAVSERAGRKIPIFFDQAYELLRHDPEIEPPESALPCDETGIVYEIGSLSKIFAPAMRIGYLVGPGGDLMKALIQKTSDAGFSAPVFGQEMASWLLDNCIEEQLLAVNAGYREKAVAVKAAIDEHLGPHLEECRGGSAGFYFYLTLKEVETHSDSNLFRRLTRKTGDPAIDGAGEVRPRVFYIPGEHCVHPCGDLIDVGLRQMRLSYGYEETDRIVEAVRMIKEEIERP